MENRPRVGIGVVIKNNGKVLLGKRKNAHGDGTWAFPGGHLEYGESWEECAAREVAEEVGISVKNFRLGKVTNDIFPKENKHYITLLIEAEYVSGEPKVLEPLKCEGWEWKEWNDFPDNLFIATRNARKEGYNPFQRK